MSKNIVVDQKTRIQGLDLVRAIAILSVIFYHLVISVPQLPKIIYHSFISGWSGVDLFFVLSGYLIAGQSLKVGVSNNRTKDIKIFWIKRWFRTFPLYFAMLFIYVYLKPILFNAEFNGNPIYYLFFVQNYVSPRDFVQSWSLCIEEQFYIIFPLIFYLIPLKKIKSWMWLIPIGVSIYFRIKLLGESQSMPEPDFSYLVRFKTHMHLDGISLGVFLAWSENMWRAFVSKNHKKLFYSGLTCYLLFSYLSGHTPTGWLASTSYLLLAISGALMLTGSLDLQISKNLFRLAYFVSITSYGAYL